MDITSIGLWLMPLSFIAFFILRISEYFFKSMHYSKLVKFIWYLAIGTATVSGDTRIEVVVTMMIFLDAFDSLLEFLEEKRDRVA